MTGRVGGKVAFITGAARGQGRSHAIRLAEEGADIIAVDLCGPVSSVPYPMSSKEDLKETARAVEALDRRVITRIIDVRDLDALQEAVNDGYSAFDRIDIVCANAGIATNAAGTINLSSEQWCETIDICLTGVWHTCKATVPSMIAGGRGGSIIVTSSAAGVKPMQNIGHYVAAKHGVIGLTKTLALELAPESIRVNCLAPTQVDTPMIMNESVYRLCLPGSENPTREEFAPVSQSLNVLPIPWVEPQDVSNAVLFLASDEARYITGIVLPVDAGAIIKLSFTYQHLA